MGCWPSMKKSSAPLAAAAATSAGTSQRRPPLPAARLHSDRAARIARLTTCGRALLRRQIQLLPGLGIGSRYHGSEGVDDPAHLFVPGTGPGSVASRPPAPFVPDPQAPAESAQGISGGSYRQREGQQDTDRDRSRRLMDPEESCGGSTRPKHVRPCRLIDDSVVAQLPLPDLQRCIIHGRHGRAD